MANVTEDPWGGGLVATTATPVKAKAKRKKPTGPTRTNIGGLSHCDGHSDPVFYHEWSHCPACGEKERQKEKLADLRYDLKDVKLQLKLARYELKEERQKHGLTKLEAAPYLTKKQKVETMVKERM